MRPLLALIVLIAALVPVVRAQNPGDWPLYGRDAGGTKFSPLDQITAANVANVQVAWVYRTGEPGTAGPETTPVVVNTVMYISTTKQRVVALDAATGKELWQFDPQVVGTAREHRGVSYWPGDGKTTPRIMLATSDGRLFALEAETGRPAQEFGQGGPVNLRTGIMEPYPTSTMYSVSSPPAIYRNLAILGPQLPEGPNLGPPGSARAFDIRTGREVWSFRTVPQGSEPGSDSWGGPDGWKGRNGPSAWGGFTVDTERGIVFVPTGNASDSFYGGMRKGLNLYSATLLALDANTGKLKWHFQTVHHDVYDYDLNSGPTLVEVVQNGRRIPAVAQQTKMGLLFILDRETGKPIFGVEERPVPKSDVPTEETWATQPFPVKPPPLARMSMKRDEVPHLSPESDAFCQDLWDRYPNHGPFTPPLMTGSSLFPGTAGGGSFGGVSYDPNLNLIFTNTQSVGQLLKMIVTPPGATGAGGQPPLPYRNQGGGRFVDENGYPCNAPPWGELAAVSTVTGDVVWRVPLGSYPELEAKGFKSLGTPNLGGSIATAGGVVFIGATADRMFRAFDSKTGKLLWSTELEATANATPSTYLGIDGKQYVVVYAAGGGHLRAFAGGRTVSDTVVAFRLP